MGLFKKEGGQISKNNPGISQKRKAHGAKKTVMAKKWEKSSGGVLTPGGNAEAARKGGGRLHVLRGGSCGRLSKKKKEKKKQSPFKAEVCENPNGGGGTPISGKNFEARVSKRIGGRAGGPGVHKEGKKG